MQASHQKEATRAWLAAASKSRTAEQGPVARCGMCRCFGGVTPYQTLPLLPIAYQRFPGTSSSKLAQAWGGHTPKRPTCVLPAQRAAILVKLLTACKLCLLHVSQVLCRLTRTGWRATVGNGGSRQQ